MIVIFDMVGTLFSLEPIEKRMQEEGLCSEMFHWWFARLLQSSMAATLAGRYLPFRDVAESSLKQLLAQLERPPGLADPILAGFNELPPWPEALSCLQKLRSRSHVVALTNSSKQAAEVLLQRSGLRESFTAVFSTDEAGACKPDPRAYLVALRNTGCEPGEACMVAAHGWDVLGASRVGLQTVWVEQLEKRWPFPGEPPGKVAATLAPVPELILSIDSGKR